jgi:SAM (Sterile alpha motif) domain-containing protein
MRGIAEWLASIGLEEYAQRFAENAIDLSVVRDLTEQDLKDLGVLLGHRRKMLRADRQVVATGRCRLRQRYPAYGNRQDPQDRIAQTL